MPAPEDLVVLQRECPNWVEEMDGRGVRLFGQELELPEGGRTVRVREGETIVSDGPFAETKEFVAEFDLIDCADLDEAIEIAAKHPCSWFQTIEIRPFADGPMGPGLSPAAWTSIAEVPVPALFADAPAGLQRYVLFMYVDGIPASDEAEAAIGRDSISWLNEATTQGTQVYGHALAHADVATTGRVRNGEALISDGPFMETKEFISGFDVVDCAASRR